MAKRKEEYGNESIKSLKGADRVRKRPAVIFGSDGVEGCAHSIFEIISNSIVEARDGLGNRSNVIRPNSAGTGIWFFASSTPAASTARGTATMIFPWASTVWVCVPPSMPASG